MKVMVNVIDAKILEKIFKKKPEFYIKQLKSIITTSTEHFIYGNSKIFYQQNSCNEIFKNVEFLKITSKEQKRLSVIMLK